MADTKRFIETLNFTAHLQRLTNHLCYFGAEAIGEQLAIEPLKWYSVDNNTWLTIFSYETQAEAEAEMMFDRAEQYTLSFLSVMPGYKFLLCQAAHLEKVSASVMLSFHQ
jgi:hypothetical protein